MITASLIDVHGFAMKPGRPSIASVARTDDLPPQAPRFLIGFVWWDSDTDSNRAMRTARETSKTRVRKKESFGKGSFSKVHFLEILENVGFWRF